MACQRVPGTDAHHGLQAAQRRGDEVVGELDIAHVRNDEVEQLGAQVRGEVRCVVHLHPGMNARVIQKSTL